jgi:hypothetical protein
VYKDSHPEEGHGEGRGAAGWGGIHERKKSPGRLKRQFQWLVFGHFTLSVHTPTIQSVINKGIWYHFHFLWNYDWKTNLFLQLWIEWFTPQFNFI